MVGDGTLNWKMVRLSQGSDGWKWMRFVKQLFAHPTLCLCEHIFIFLHLSYFVWICVFWCSSRRENTKCGAELTRTWGNHSNHLARGSQNYLNHPHTPPFSFKLNTTKTRHDCAGISTGPLRRAAADVINGVWWIMSILCDWTEPAESLKVREEHIADCFPKTAHWSLSDGGHLV